MRRTRRREGEEIRARRAAFKADDMPFQPMPQEDWQPHAPGEAVYQEDPWEAAFVPQAQGDFREPQPMEHTNMLRPAGAGGLLLRV